MNKVSEVFLKYRMANAKRQRPMSFLDLAAAMTSAGCKVSAPTLNRWATEGRVDRMMIFYLANTGQGWIKEFAAELLAAGDDNEKQSGIGSN